MTTNKPTTEQSQKAQIETSLNAMGPQLKAALPPHIPVERFIRVAQTAILTSPSVLKCERNSLFAACLKAAQDGLLPDGKEAALVPFKDKQGNAIATYMPMVAGILKKCRNSGDLSSIMSEIVYSEDEFDYWVDETGPHLKHRPAIMKPDRGQPVGVYAIANTKDGASYIEFMTKNQVDDVADSSRSKSDGPWSGPFATEMARKSVIRRLSKRLPMSTDLEEVIHRDDQFYDFQNREEAPKQVTDNASPNRLKSLMGVDKKNETPPPAQAKQTVEAEVVDDHDEPERNEPV